MQLVDTHCHIQSLGAVAGEPHTRELWAKAGNLTADSVIAGAREAGVTRLVCVGCDLEDSRLATEFVEEREGCWASIGMHPHEARLYAEKPELLEAFAALASQPKVVAVGECGFDFYYNHSPKEAQKEVLRFQLDLAAEHNLPVIFHVREAFDDFWPVFDTYEGKLRGVLHSFTDSQANLDKALERGLYIGVNGIATFAKKEEQLAMYRAIPLTRLLLETDAPYLTPTPYRGTINEPKFTRRVGEFLSGLRGDSLESLAAATTRNAQTLFNI